jgi:hypothetical protein
MSIADQIINGTYGKKNANSGIAESIINGTFEEQRRKKEEEKKRREEQMKIQTSNVVLPMNLKKETSSKIVLPMKSNDSKLNRQTLPVNTWNDLKYNLQQGTITNDKQGTRVTLQDASAMKEAEQINKDIENKNYNSSVAHILNSFPEGIKKGVTGIANSGLLPIARNAQKISDFGKKIGVLKDDNFLNESKSKILDVAEELSQKSSYRSKVNKDVNNNVVNMASNINNVIGNMVPSMVANFVAPGSGLALTGLSSGGNSAQETINEDRSNLSEAIKTGILKGAVEAGTEKLTGGNIIAKGSLDDLAGKFISEKVKSKVGKFIANKAYGFLGEMTEEQISDNAGYIIDKIINKKELPSFKEWWNNAGETNKITFLSTLALNLVGLGGSDVSKEYESKINEVMNVAQKDPEIKKQIEKIKSNQSQMSNELNNILNNKKLPMQKYQYEKSENVKIDRLRQDANRYFNNTEQAHNFVDMLEKIVTDKNIDIRLDSSLKSPDGRKANGSYSDGVITINPNSTRTGEFIAIHELTHAIGTDQMKGIIDNYRKSNMEFDTSVKQLLNNYNSTEITEEALSDVSAQLFGTQDFINNIAQNNPNIFQRIYSEIKYLWHQFRGYKNQNQFVEDLYYKWTQAYNRKNRLNDNSNYSIQADNNGNKYVQIDTDQDIFKGKSLSEQTKIAKRYILDNFREKGINLDNENIKITMKTANEYTHPKNKLPAITKESKIKASTELDNLLNVSEYQYSTEDDGRHPFAKDGWDYYKTTFEVNGLKFEGLINIAKSGNKKTLYDVTKIKRISQNYSASDKSFSVSLTNSNNSIPPSNKDVNTTKYSMQESENNSQLRQEWQEYLEKNFNTVGTRTSLKDIKLPIDKDIMQQNKINSTVVNQEVAEDNISRKSIIEKNRELAKDKIKNIAKWKDKSMGLKYQRETIERNMFDIISNKQEAQDIIDTYFTPVHEAEAEKQRFINSYNDKIERLNLNQYESEAVQLLGEAKYNPDFKSDEEVVKTLKSINKNINQGKIDKAKVEKAIDTLRNIYDEILELENQVLRANGYAEIKYRTGYFPHFIDYQPVTKAEKVLDKLGIEIDKRPLPTNIAGRTEQFVPGKTWNRSSLNRKTDKTTYNALKGFDTYIRQAADTIFHTENIQRLRGLENEIRYQYSDKGIQEKIDKIYDNEILTPQEKMMEISKVFDVADNPMPNLVVELRRYTNALANKKSEADRSLENRISRSIYSTTKAIENRFGANAIGLNIGSAITNFIAITQAYSQISTKNIGRATIDTIKSYISDDGFINESTFLTNRLKQADKLYKTSLEKIRDKTSFLFNAIDNVASNIIVRGKYLDNIDKGMTAKEALKNANLFGANVMADRSKGALPTLFEEKNPISKAFTQFQLEVNNQYSYMFKDIPRDLKDKGLANIALAYFKMFVAAYLFNWTSEKITGRKSAFSPIDIAVDSFETLNTPNMNTADKLINVGTDIVQELPFIGGLAGGGRIPVSGAIPDAENTFKAISGLATGEINSSKAVKTLLNEISKPASYLLLPFGGGQVRKTVEGVGTILAGGSYGVDSEGKETLKFPVEKANLGTYMKAGIFGKYALPEAKSYADNNYKSLNAKQTEMYKYAKLPYKQLLEYTNSKLKKKEDKIKYLQDQNWTEQQKWGIFKYDILNNTERDDGGSQLKDAEYIISTGTSKTEFMKSYDKAQKNNIDIPTEKEYKKMNESGLKFKTYIDYKVTEKNETQKRKKQGRLKENQSLKAKDKIQILLDSTYSNKEIGAIYENYIKTEKDTEYDIIVNNAKVDIKTYLKFKQQEFESDKKDDGTLNGKTVSKSKQKKLIEYLNKIHANKEITGNQSLLLYAIHGYATTSSQKKQLVNYVQSLSLKRNEKLKLFDKFSGFTVYKDGRVKYK